MLWQKAQQQLPYWREHAIDLPMNLFNALQQQQKISSQLNQITQALQQNARQRQKSALLWLGGLIFFGVIWQYNQLPSWLSLSGLACSLGLWFYGLWRR